jgi:hypothetical protein
VKIAFRYHGRHRVLRDPVVRFTKKLDLIIIGTDADHGGVRTFRVDRIVGRIKHVDRQAEEAVALRPGNRPPVPDARPRGRRTDRASVFVPRQRDVVPDDVRAGWGGAVGNQFAPHSR